MNRLSWIIRASWRSSGGTICIASLLLSNSTIIQPQCTPASQPQSACVTKCEPNCSRARSALSQVSYSSSWCSSIIYRGMRGPLSLKCWRQNTRRSIPKSTRSPRAHVDRPLWSRRRAGVLRGVYYGGGAMPTGGHAGRHMTAGASASAHVSPASSRYSLCVRQSPTHDSTIHHHLLSQSSRPTSRSCG